MGKWGDRIAMLDDCCPGGTKADGTFACHCRLACLDMIEDRVRNRYVGVALIFLLFAPLMGLMILGDINDPDAVKADYVNFTSVINPEKAAGQLANVCVAEVECARAIGDPMVVAAAELAGEDLGCPDTCISLLRDVNMTALGLLTPPPPSMPPVPPGLPPLPPSEPGDVLTEEEMGITLQTFIAFIYVLVSLAMIGTRMHRCVTPLQVPSCPLEPTPCDRRNLCAGNSGFHSRRWVVISFVAAIAVLCIMLLFLNPGTPVFGWWITACIVVIFFYGVIFIGLAFKFCKRQPPKLSGKFMEEFDDHREETCGSLFRP